VSEPTTMLELEDRNAGPLSFVHTIYTPDHGVLSTLYECCRRKHLASLDRWCVRQECELRYVFTFQVALSGRFQQTLRWYSLQSTILIGNVVDA